MHTVDLCRARNADISSTSQHQQWHKARGKKIYGQPVSSVVVAKAKVNRKRKPIMSSFIHNNCHLLAKLALEQLLSANQMTFPTFLCHANPPASAQFLMKVPCSITQN
ncbi:hypothetical protein AMECASPLE_037641 [Ameca splendens]|uniref:Uncharacterized protein n=1 Tax=Ameca splendens TaxID=208324 RepID=A0ABV0ZSV9_9TELE